MASPPFTIDQSLPEDDDIVSQHPANARTFRDVVESWLLTEHNVSGRHDKVSLDYLADPSGTASVTRMWASSTGNAAGALKMRQGSGNVEYVGVPPGTVLFYAVATAPEGWLNANGAAVSRTTYARLFDIIGTTFGVGDGSTTFNLPDVTGRTIFGKEASATRLTSAGSSIVGSTLGATGGAETVTLARANLPNDTLAITIASGQGSHDHVVNSKNNMSYFGILLTAGAGEVMITNSGSTDIRTLANTLPAMTGTSPLNGGVTQTGTNKVPPAIVLLAIIKT